MKHYVVEGTVRVLTPLFHGGDEKTGSTPILRSIMVYVPDFGEVAIPFYSGNALRGKLRRMLMKDFLDLIDYEITNSKLYHMMFAGGVLETSDMQVGVVDLELRKRIRQLIPPLALLGGAIGNQLIPGVLIVEHMFPICKEYRFYLPAWAQEYPEAQKPVRIFTDQSFITRRDDLRVERQEDEQAVQMKVDYECFVPGTLFYHRFVLQIPTELQVATLGRAIELLYDLPYLGGRSSSGDGKVQFDYKNVPSSELYIDFVQHEQEQIRELLNELAGML